MKQAATFEQLLELREVDPSKAFQAASMNVLELIQNWTITSEDGEIIPARESARCLALLSLGFMHGLYMVKK
jgi:hypothetical protein